MLSYDCELDFVLFNKCMFETYHKTKYKGEEWVKKADVRGFQETIFF